jgi:hypothetical protein
MSRPAIYFAITNHGFGHAVRAASIANAIQKLNPEILLILVTTAPHWLLESYIEGDFIVRPRAFDVGVVQSDSLTMDKSATLEKLKEIQNRQHSLIAGEVDFIRLNRVGLILADIPPLAAPIAKAAGIPCWMLSNFGWDFIYQPWGGEFVKMAEWIAECFGQCDQLFRLPLHEKMSAFPNITDVGLTGGTPRYSEAKLREMWNLTVPKEKIILLTFGGLSLAEIPYHNLKNFPDWQFITFDRNAPDMPNLIRVANKMSQDPQLAKIRPVDFMPACGRVISKPGYSTFSEAIRLECPIISLTRDDFAEASLLLEGIQNYTRHQIIQPAEFFEQDWEFLYQSPLPPRSPHSLAKDGTETIAKAAVQYFQAY